MLRSRSRIACPSIPCCRCNLGVTAFRTVLIFNVLAPVFLLIALGVVLVRIRFVSEAFLRETNRVTYWLGLPALLFGSLAQSFHDAAGARALLFTLLAATAAVVAAAYILARLLRLPFSAYGTFVQGAFRGNLAYVGLPIVYSLPELPGTDGLSSRAAAIIAVAPMLVLYNVLGVSVLVASQHQISRQVVWPLVRQLCTTPPLLATLAGIGWALTGWPLPPALAQSFDWLGQMALPLALLGIGGALARTENARKWPVPAFAAALKVAFAPLIGWAFAHWFHLTEMETTLAMIFLACPTAGISYTMVTQLDGDEAMASSTILFSTIASVLALSLIVARL